MLILIILLFFNIKCNKFPTESTFIKRCQNGELMKMIPALKPFPKISVYVAAYNMQNHILTTIRSVQNQNFNDFEMVIVDDGSTDDTAEKIKTVAAQDQRIILLQNEENRGLLYSKAKAAKHTVGEYLLQLDADDALCNPFALNILLDKAEETKVDIVHFSVLRGRVSHLESYDYANPPDKGVSNIIIQPELRHFLKKNGKASYEWSKLYKRRTMIKALEYIGNDITDTHCNNLESKIKQYACGRIAESYIGIKDYLLWYNDENKDSLMRRPYNDKKAFDFLFVMNTLYELSDKKPEDQVLLSSASWMFFNEELRGYFRGSKENYPKFLGYCFKFFFSENIPDDLKERIRNICNPDFAAYLVAFLNKNNDINNKIKSTINIDTQLQNDIQNIQVETNKLLKVFSNQNILEDGFNINDDKNKIDSSIINLNDKNVTDFFYKTARKPRRGIKDYQIYLLIGIGFIFILVFIVGFYKVHQDYELLNQQMRIKRKNFNQNQSNKLTIENNNENIKIELH